MGVPQELSTDPRRGFVSVLDRVFADPGDEERGYDQGAHGGRRTDGVVLYESYELQLHPGEGRFHTPAIKVYAAVGEGADEDAIEHFRATGCLERHSGGHQDHGKVL